MRITAFSLSCLLSVLFVSVVFAQDPPAPTTPDKQGRHKAKKLQQMDANNDGQIGRDEWKGRPKGFDKLDADRDGFLSVAELSKRRRRG